MTIQTEGADKTLQTFFDGCVAAGPDDCPFFAASSTQISANLDNLTASVKTQPFPVITPSLYGVLDLTLLRNFVFSALVDPYSLFLLLAQGLADLAKGNATTAYTAIVAPPFECECECGNAKALPFHENSYEAGIAITCGDGTPVSSSFAELQESYAGEQKVSSFADLFANLRVQCSYVFI